MWRIVKGNYANQDGSTPLRSNKKKRGPKPQALRDLEKQLKDDLAAQEKQVWLSYLLLPLLEASGVTQEAPPSGYCS